MFAWYSHKKTIFFSLLSGMINSRRDKKHRGETSFQPDNTTRALRSSW